MALSDQLLAHGSLKSILVVTTRGILRSLFCNDQVSVLWPFHLDGQIHSQLDLVAHLGGVFVLIEILRRQPPDMAHSRGFLLELA